MLSFLLHQPRPAIPLLAALLAGCGDTLWTELVPSWPERPEAEATAPPPAGPALRLTLRGRPYHAVLVQSAGDRRLWRTEGNQAVETDGGRVVATAGFGEMLAATRLDGPDPLAEPAALLDRPAVARRLVDLMGPDRTPASMRFGLPVECRVSAAATGDPAVLLVEERCRASGAGRFTNRFRVTAEGAVLQAEQWIGPGLPMLVVEFLDSGG